MACEIPGGAARAVAATGSAAESASRNGPDFICIGMPRSGTGWLFDQMQHHPDFWMPPVKELQYLDREFPRMMPV